MFLTETDFVNRKLAAEGERNVSDIIRGLIADDLLSEQKKRMTEGERYYVGEHDVLKKDFCAVTLSETDTDTGTERLTQFQNPNRSNYHAVNPFHKILVDQKTAYIAGREPTVSVKGAEENPDLAAYEKLLAEFFDEEFNETLSELIIGASNKGMEALHVYFTENGEFQYTIVPATELIPIYDTAYQRELLEVIRYYDITVVEGKRKYLRKRVEWWTKKDVTYYIEKEQGHFVLDDGYRQNPAAHWQEIVESDFTKRYESHNFGRVPFLFLKNNGRCTTDLQCIKGLIDAYDLISSEGTNNLLDLVDLYWSISGYGGETASTIFKKLKINKGVNVSDSNGKIEAKQVDLPVTGRLEWMKMLRRDIYQFGMGIDVDADKFGNAPSGVSLKFQYGSLDLKAGRIEAKIKKLIKELIWYFTEYHNRIHGTAYDSRLVEVSLNYSAITNDLEAVNMIAASEGLLSQKTLVAKHPFVSDVNAEMEAVAAEKEESVKGFYNVGGETDDNQ